MRWAEIGGMLLAVAQGCVAQAEMRISLRNQYGSILHMCEVRMFVTQGGVEREVQLRDASSSSAFVGGGPELAIDGIFTDASQYNDQGSCFHSDYSEGAPANPVETWEALFDWESDVFKPEAVRVENYLRIDCCRYRNIGVAIYINDLRLGEIWSQFERIPQVAQTFPFRDTNMIQVNHQVRPLVLCEVELYNSDTGQKIGLRDPVGIGLADGVSPDVVVDGDMQVSNGASCFTGRSTEGFAWAATLDGTGFPRDVEVRIYPSEASRADLVDTQIYLAGIPLAVVEAGDLVEGRDYVSIVAPTKLTEFPTRTPTRSPTYSPTSAPSIAPTRAPPSTPTKPPSPFPPYEPTTTPSSTPIESPSGTPTHSQTLAPSSPPTVEPTSAPTINEGLAVPGWSAILLGALLSGGSILGILMYNRRDRVLGSSKERASTGNAVGIESYLDTNPSFSNQGSWQSGSMTSSYDDRMSTLSGDPTFQFSQASDKHLPRSPRGPPGLLPGANPQFSAMNPASEITSSVRVRDSQLPEKLGLVGQVDRNYFWATRKSTGEKVLLPRSPPSSPSPPPI